MNNSPVIETSRLVEQQRRIVVGELAQPFRGQVLEGLPKNVESQCCVKVSFYDGKTEQEVYVAFSSSKDARAFVSNPTNDLTLVLRFEAMVNFSLLEGNVKESPRNTDGIFGAFAFLWPRKE